MQIKTAFVIITSFFTDKYYVVKMYTMFITMIFPPRLDPDDDVDDRIFAIAAVTRTRNPKLI